MTVQELFEQADRKSIAHKIACFDMEAQELEDQEKDEMIQEYESDIMESFEEMLSLIPDGESDWIIICVYQTDLEYMDNCYISASGIKKQDLKTKEIFSFDPDITVDEDTYSNEYIQSYGLEFMDWSEVLAMEVGQGSIDKYGMNECAEAIYREMTFCGMFYDEQRMTSEKEIEDLLEVISSIEEEETAPFSQEELLEALGLENMTEEETRYMEEIIKEELIINSKELQDIITKERDYILEKEA